MNIKTEPHMTKYYTFILSAILSVSAIAQQASYEPPTGLRNIGMIQNPRINPACSYLTRNPMNEGAFLWTPAGSTVMYTDTSVGTPKSWNWTCDGGEINNAGSQDATVTYNTPGTYSFPVEKVSYAEGVQTVAPEWKIKVGGVAEICLADTREWMNTYALGANNYPMGNGCLGGANKLNIAGVGNFYMIPGNEIFLDGVNVYLVSKPKKWPADRKLTVSVYMSDISQNEVSFTNPLRTLESGFLSYSDVKTEEDGAWVPIEGGAVLQLKFSNPVDLFGKPFIFISVSGWGNDPSKEDLSILTDIMPNIQMSQEDVQNLLAHNSFARLDSESDYLRPISYYGGNTGSFMICPVLRGYETPLSGISNIPTAENTPVNCIVSGSSATLTGTDGAYAIYTISGAMQHSGMMNGGSANFDVSSWPAGVYVARDAIGSTTKFILR